MSSLNLQHVHDTLVAIAFEAGRMVREAKPQTKTADTKMNSVDMVTETDKAVERLVMARLQTAYPTFDFVGEESYQRGTTAITDRPTFVVDPIDGTTNFIHGFPAVCVSLGFLLDRLPAAGVVYSPFDDVLFTGVRGGGAYMQRCASLVVGGNLAPGFSIPRERLPLRCADGDSSKAAPLTGLGSALVAVEWGADRDGANFELKASVFRRLAAGDKTDGGRMCHSLRSMGSAALNLCAVAAGQLDAYWEGGCYAWDVAAGWCILNEAGGIMASGNPGVWGPAVDSRKYLAVRGAPSGQKALVEEFWSVIGDGAMEYEH
ncbi:hypothetical protein RB595_001978 [Gaeumannomyces hyphopodioides]